MTRGLLLVPVFLLWICISFFSSNSGIQNSEVNFKGNLSQLLFRLLKLVSLVGRELLALTQEENETIDNLTYLTPKEKEERKEGNCTPPAIEQFPVPLMDNYYRQHGGLVIHILIAIYMFIGLAIVCDDYFVPALDRIAEGTLILTFFHVHKSQTLFI